MKRTLASLLCVLLTISVFAACGEQAQGGAPAASTTAPAEGGAAAETEAEITDGLPDTDLQGWTFKIHHFDDSWLTWALTQLDAKEENGELLNDSIYRRNRGIEERFNCKLDISDEPNIDENTLLTAALAGDDGYDLWFAYDLRIVGAAQVLTSWDDIPYIRLSSEWWNPQASDVFRLGGKLYAAAGNYSLSVLSRAAGYCFNKGIFADLNLGEDIYQIASDGKWTLQKLYDYSKAAASDLNGDGQMDENDRYGITGSWKEVMNRMMLGSGIQYISKDENGYPVFSLPEDEGAITKMMHIYDLFTDPDVYHGKKANVAETGSLGDFKNSGALFAVDNLLGLGNKRDYDIDIGFVPCPKYDESQSEYYAPSFGAEISVILKNVPVERYENMGLLLEAMAFATNRDIIPDYKEVLLKTKYARDNESEAMIDIVINSISFEFGLNAWQETVANPLVIGTFCKFNNNFVSQLEKMSKPVNKTIDKLIAAIEADA